MVTFSRGAEWRKWDLHVHTPASYDYKDKSVSCDDIIQAVLRQGIAVIAVTDHHIMDVDKIKELQNIGEIYDVVVLPGIEFLSDARGKEPVHFIGIFSESCNLEYIWGQIQNSTAIKNVAGKGKNVNEVYCDLEDTINLVHELGGVVSVHSGQKHGSVENITNSLDHTRAQKEDIAHNVDIYEIGKVKDQDGYKNIVFPAIKKTLPMIICSDNHDCKDFKLKENCWIKAEPTFEGLQQILNEPEERVFIGNSPEIFDRVAMNRTKYIQELQVSSVTGYGGEQGKWFDGVCIPFNSELVAIIGNKGSGKSAVADIAALCGNYKGDDFSFLTKDKFRTRKGRIADKFEAALIWASDIKTTINLNDAPIISSLEEVKYIPQGQFEILTNEIEDAKKFQEEIESVVFSHIDDPEKYGSLNFEELIESKKKFVATELKVLFEKIDTLNSAIIKLEAKKSEEHKNKLNNLLVKKNEELIALIEPIPVSNPNEDLDKKKLNEVALNEIAELKSQIVILEDSVALNNNSLGVLLQDLKDLKEARQEIAAKSDDLDKFKNRVSHSLSKHGIEVDQIISIKYNSEPVDKVIFDKNESLEKIKIALGKVPSTDGASSLPDQILFKKNELQNKQSKLDSEQQKYQEYLNAKLVWEKQQKRIIGGDSVSGTINFYKKEIEYIENKLANDLSDRYEERKATVRDIYKKRYEVVNVYKKAKESLARVIEENSDILGDYKIAVDAAMVADSSFESEFLRFINQAKAGTFWSKEGGDKEFKQIVLDVNFDEENEVICLLDLLLNALNHDFRDGQKSQERVISEQTKDLHGLYDYIFKLKFLNYNYQLKQGDKKLEQLSPGERGALLLVFYLLLDKNDIPLIIDQPEDNLDNNSVAKILVPFIRKAKKRRQIIIVTHNPNLAVVSDAEQVIYVSLDKDDNYKFSTVSGSIENRVINRKIVDVLEGAMPAFNVRKSKYYG